MVGDEIMRLTFKEIKDEISKIVPRNIEYSVDLEAGDIAIFTKDIEAFTQNDGLGCKDFEEDQATYRNTS